MVTAKKMTLKKLEEEAKTGQVDGNSDVTVTPDEEGKDPAATTTAPSEETTTETTTETTEESSETESSTTEAGTVAAEPAADGGSQLSGNLLIAALAVILALIVAVVADILRKKKKKKNSGKAAKKEKEKTVPVEPAQEKTMPSSVTTPASAAKAAASAVSVSAAGPQIRVGIHQHVGARKDQQDSYGVSEPGSYAQAGVMAIVADGMGGLSNGQMVSSALVRTFLDGFRRAAGGYQNSADLLLELAVRANAAINEMLRGADRSGSTLLSAVIRNGYLHFLTVGDSRIYLYRGGALIQLNREHIYQEELAGKAVNQVVALQQVRSDRQAHSLTSYFGIGRIPSIDRNDEGIRLLDGDKIILASDGVFGTLSAAQMEDALRSDVNEAAIKIGALIRQADRPYQDNNTAVILEYRA